MHQAGTDVPYDGAFPEQVVEGIGANVCGYRQIGAIELHCCGPQRHGWYVGRRRFGYCGCPAHVVRLVVSLNNGASVNVAAAIGERCIPQFAARCVHVVVIRPPHTFLETVIPPCHTFVILVTVRLVCVQLYARGDCAARVCARTWFLAAHQSPYHSSPHTPVGPCDGLRGLIPVAHLLNPAVQGDNVSTDRSSCRIVGLIRV
mmetsp:Transcript_94936/g.163776  ORF Transcript_94936/g.163776 Transcript_94936/m.163776 type:complete len:203 (+) Transcript_94936:1564-2172(+)